MPEGKKFFATPAKACGYNTINMRSNYQPLEIPSPKDIIENED